MKTIFVSMAAMLTVSCTQLRPASVTAAPRALSSYVLDNGAQVSNQPVLQTNLTLAARSGLYANLFQSSGSTPGGSELDATVGWSGELLPTWVSADLNLSYYDLDRVLHGPRGDSAVPLGELRATWTVGDHAVAPLLRGLAYLPLDERTGDPDGLVGPGVRHAWEVTEWLTLNQRADVVYDTGGLFGNDSGWLTSYAIGASWPITDWCTVDFPGVRISAPLTHFADGRETEVVVWGGLTFLFDLPQPTRTPVHPEEATDGRYPDRP